MLSFSSNFSKGLNSQNLLEDHWRSTNFSRVSDNLKQYGRGCSPDICKTLEPTSKYMVPKLPILNSIRPKLQKYFMGQIRKDKGEPVGICLVPQL